MPNRRLFGARPQRAHTNYRPNYPLLYLVAAFLGLGLIMVYSASAVLAFSEGKSTFTYFLLQIGWVIVGTILAYAAYRIPLKLVAQSSIIVMVVTIVLLILVLIVGKNLNGATRWIDLGPFDLQPSEVAKLGFVIYLSAWLSRKRPVLKNFQQVFQQHLYNDLLPFMLLLGIVSVLIILQPDLDTTAIVVLTSLVVYFVSGNDALHTLGSIFIIITSGIVGVIAAFAASYRVDRIRTYFDFLRTGQVVDSAGKGFQVLNGLIAIGTGGLLGVGFGNSKQKLFYLNQAAFTDSIYAIIAEEFGLLGSVIVIIGFLYFMSIGVNIARRAPDKFSALLAMGITTWITLQAFLNIGANLAVIPFGGIPLPFISYGGSNTLIVMVGVGLLLNIDRAGQMARGSHR